MISRNDKVNEDVFNDVVEYVEKNEPTFILHSNDGYMTKVNKVSKYLHMYISKYSTAAIRKVYQHITGNFSEREKKVL